MADDNPNLGPHPNTNTEKDPDEWVSGDDPMTGLKPPILRPCPSKLVSLTFSEIACPKRRPASELTSSDGASATRADRLGHKSKLRTRRHKKIDIFLDKRASIVHYTFSTRRMGFASPAQDAHRQLRRSAKAPPQSQRQARNQDGRGQAGQAGYAVAGVGERETHSRA
jgi:hypothetical protein